MLSQRRIQWYNIQPTKRQVNVLAGGPLNVFPFDKRIKVYLKVQKLSGDLILISKIWSLKFQFKMAAQKPGSNAIPDFLFLTTILKMRNTGISSLYLA